jgi:hypothetical protein
MFSRQPWPQKRRGQQEQEQAQQEQQAVSHEQSAAYQRAFGACMEGRGYTAK